MIEAVDTRKPLRLSPVLFRITRNLRQHALQMRLVHGKVLQITEKFWLVVYLPLGKK